MAFASTGGYTNLPNGNWSPVVYSQKVIKGFRKLSVVEDITNTDYSGEIEKYGDTVQIIKEPDVTITSYVRGKQLTSTPLVDDKTTLIVDQANAFQFAVDDIERKHGHVNFMELASNRAAYNLKKKYDNEVLSYITSNVATANRYGNNDVVGSLIDMGLDTGEITPLAVMNRLKRMLDENDVPEDNRWFVTAPRFYEVLGSEDSKIMDHDYTGTGENLLRNGKVAQGMIRGFKVHQSNNMTTGTLSGTTWYVALAGHKSAVATASQLTQVENFRSQNFFGDVVRGMHLYGRTLLRSEALVACFYKID